MKLDYVPLLQVQRELYDIARCRERFKAYLAAMTDPRTGDLALPLSAMNPMGKDHVPSLLDQYIALGVDNLAGRAVREAQAALEPLWATVMACVFGDAAARALGYPPEGLSERAGLALALSDARTEAGQDRLRQPSQ